MRQHWMVFVLVVGACGGHGLGDVDDTVGNACTRDSDCDDRCLPPSGDFPGGFCTLTCRDDRDCPGDTFCIDRDGGVCLFICPEFRCSDLGAGWECKDEDDVSGARVSVCRG